MSREFEIETGPLEVLSETESRCVLLVRVPDDLIYVEGHFEHEPIVPGVAQLLPLVYEPALRVWPDLGPAKEIRRLKFLGAIRPGHTLTVTLTRTPGRLRFEIQRGQEVCTRGSYLLAEAAP